MRLDIYPSLCFLSGSAADLDKVDQLFSYKNKAAQNQLKRFKFGLIKRERGLYMAHHGELPEAYTDWKNEKLQELKDKVDVHLCKYTPGPRGTMEQRLLVPTGLVPTLLKYVMDNQITDFSYTDHRDFDNMDKRSLNGVKPRYLRRPQEEGMKAAEDASVKGIGTFRIATGCGKTLLAQELIRQNGVKSIFLVPSIPILKQTVRRFEAAFGKKNVKAYGGTKKDVGYITVATYQSIYRAKQEDLKALSEIDMMIADEVHHVGAETFFDVATEKLKGAKIRYGLTAYEERADNGTMMVEAATGPVIYSYDAVEGIKDGYLAKPTYMIYGVYNTKGKWTRYEMKKKKGAKTYEKLAVEIVESQAYDGDNPLEAYRHWVLGNDLLNSAITKMVAGLVSDGKSVLFLVDEIDHGNILLKKFEQLGIEAGYCTGGGKDNEDLMKAFNARKLKVLLGTSTLGEGADTIPVDVMVQLQGGASISGTKQADGRALRNEEDDKGVPQKPRTIIIDFDYPMCRILHRHSGIREKVHAELGDIHRGNLV